MDNGESEVMTLGEFVARFNHDKAHELIKREESKERDDLTILRESIGCWSEILNCDSNTIEEFEMEIMITLKNLWGKPASLILDRIRGTAHAIHPDGRCLDLLSGEFIEWKEDAV